MNYRWYNCRSSLCIYTSIRGKSTLNGSWKIPFRMHSMRAMYLYHGNCRCTTGCIHTQKSPSHRLYFDLNRQPINQSIATTKCQWPRCTLYSPQIFSRQPDWHWTRTDTWVDVKLNALYRWLFICTGAINKIRNVTAIFSWYSTVSKFTASHADCPHYRGQWNVVIGGVSIQLLMHSL